MAPDHRFDAPMEAAPSIRTTRTVIESEGRAVPVRLHRPDGGSGHWLVWAHGGSWRAGSAQQWHPVTAQLAAVSGRMVASVDYRLAPRHRHPAPVQDVLAVLDWVRFQAGDRNGGRVAVGGDSAGATIAACAALTSRDRGVELDAQVLAYPALDPYCRALSYHRDPTAFPQADRLLEAWSAHRGPGPFPTVAGERFYSTPWETDRYEGLAPAVLAVGDLDPVADDVEEYARRLRKASVEVAYRVFPGVGHAALLAAGGDGAGSAPAAAMRNWLGNALRNHPVALKESP